MAAAKKRRKRKASSGGGGGWRRSPITALVSIVVIVLCLYNLFLGGEGDSSRFKGDYVCRSCKEVSRISYLRTQAPHVCPSCDKQELYSALKCNDCNEVTASLPPVRNFTCAECAHFADVRLKPEDGPHPCPKCHAKAFSESYECLSCKHVFAHQMGSGSPENPSDEMEFYEDSMVATCPKCKKHQSYPFIESPVTTCEHCDSENLSSITPISVVKWELGRDLKAREQKEVDAWLEKNP